MNSRTWSSLLKAGGVAALLSAILFRRNIGAEVSLFTGVEAIPVSVAGWYTLLQSSPLLGLAFLVFFDLADYALVGLMFLALCAALWPGQKVLAAIALACGLTFAIAPTLRILLAATAGQFWMVWHLLAGIRLLQEARAPGVRPRALTARPGSGALA